MLTLAGKKVPKKVVLLKGVLVHTVFPRFQNAFHDVVEEIVRLLGYNPHSKE